jgi:hypothetical protein
MSHGASSSTRVGVFLVDRGELKDSEEVYSD